MRVDTRNYRNLLVWRRARPLAIEVCRTTGHGAFRREWGLRDQMRRAAISVPNNIAEGNERGTDRDGARFLYYARGSLAELSTQIDIACEIGLLAAPLAEQWIRECDELGRIVGALIRRRLPG
jgi:four helix bundle protein